MSVIRGNQKLAQFGDKQLAALVANCICLGIRGDDLEFHVANWQVGGRPMVVKAAVAYDLLVSKLTKVDTYAPSDESAAWSSMEGGHRFHRTPDISVSDLITGHLNIKSYTVSGN